MEQALAVRPTPRAVRQRHEEQQAGSRITALDPSITLRPASLSLPPLRIALTTAWIDTEAIIIAGASQMAVSCRPFTAEARVRFP